MPVEHLMRRELLRMMAACIYRIGAFLLHPEDATCLGWPNKAGTAVIRPTVTSKGPGFKNRDAATLSLGDPEG